jgi:hypothetical protein
MTWVKFIRHRLDTLDEARDEAREAERNKIADWFIRHNQRQLADEIRAKEHYK